MRAIGFALFAAMLPLAANPAAAARISTGGLAKKAMTYTSLAAVQIAKTNAFSGVGSVFVSRVSTATTGYGSLCTGSLINRGTVLTAAHCMYDYDEEGASDPVTSVLFILPSLGEYGNPGAEIFEANAFAYNPLYDNADHSGDIVSGYDVGLFSLSSAASGYDTYRLYKGDPLKAYLEVGTGTIGGPRGTEQGVESDYEKRIGRNLFELYGDELFSDVSHGVVLSDFDDGTARHDVFGRNLGLSQRGIFGESNSSPGDSGGPEFIDGKIATVTSFGITGGIFDGFCGLGSTDPYNADGKLARTDLDSCTNSSVGEIAGDTLVSYNMDFIKDYLAAHPPVPEPASWAMMLAGFGLIGGAMRRRRSQVSFAR